MESFNTLISLSNCKVGDDSSVRLIDEQSAIKEGKENMPSCRTNLNDFHKELIIHDMTLPILKHFININTFSLNKFAVLSDNDFEEISQDFYCLFSYFSRFSKKPDTLRIDDLRISPFALFKFLVEFFESPGSLLPSQENEQLGLSRVILKTFLSVEKLFDCETYEDFFIEIRSILKTVKEATPSIVGPLVEECATNSIISSFKNNYNKETSVVNPCRTQIIKEMGLDNEELQKLNDKYDHMDNYIALCNYLNCRGSIMKDEWIIDKVENHEMYNIAMNRMSLLTEKIGEFVINDKPKGNMIINLNIKWEPKYQNCYLNYVSFFEVIYKNNIAYFKPENDILRICIPYSDKDEPVDIRLLYLHERFKDEDIFKSTKEMRGVLHEFRLIPSKNMFLTSQSFNKPGIMPIECGKIESKVSFQKDGFVNITRSQIPPGPLNLIQVIDFFTEKIVNEWTSGIIMHIEPPQELFFGLVELALRYSIPTSMIYVMLLKKLYKCWNDSDSYLKAFGALYFVTKFCIESTETTKVMTSVFNEITEGLRTKVPAALRNHLSYVGHYQNSGIMPLLALFPLVAKLSDDEDENEDEDSLLFAEFEKIRISSKSGTIKGIISRLKPVPSYEMTTREADNLIIYMQSKGAFISIEFTEDNLENSEKPVGFMFNVETLAEAMDILLQRSKQVTKFFETNIVPIELNFQEEIHSEIKELSLLIAGVFSSMRISMDEQENIFKLFFSYRELFNIYKFGGANSPFKIFYNIVLEWISSIGPKLIEWTQNAINVDDFSVYNESMHTSTSLTDLITIFTQSSHFLDSLKWKSKNICTIIETFVSTCRSCVMLYAEELMGMILGYFPNEVVESCYSLHGIKAPQRNDNIRKISVEQIYVIINDFQFVKPSWERFVNDIRPMLGATKLPEVLEDPIPNIKKIINIIPALFSSTIERDVYQHINDRIWVHNSSFKRVFVRTASTFVLHPDFERRTSAFFSELFQSTLDFIEDRANFLSDNVNKEFIVLFLEEFVRGLDAGMMNIFIVEKPIKHKRVILILEFIKDIMSDLYEYMNDSFGVKGDKFVQWAWRSRYALDNLKKSEEEIQTLFEEQAEKVQNCPEATTDEEKLNNIRENERLMILHTICRSHTNNKKCTEITAKYDKTIINQRFIVL